MVREPVGVGASSARVAGGVRKLAEGAVEPAVVDDNIELAARKLKLAIKAHVATDDFSNLVLDTQEAWALLLNAIAA